VSEGYALALHFARPRLVEDQHSLDGSFNCRTPMFCRAAGDTSLFVRFLWSRYKATGAGLSVKRLVPMNIRSPPLSSTRPRRQKALSAEECGGISSYG
jgi:hypothetical protein